MHEAIIDELLSFAVRNGLRFDYGFDDKSKSYVFTLRGQTWGYSREISQEQLELFNGPVVYFAHDIINRVKSKVPHLF